MFRLLLLLFISVPVIEIYLLIQVGSVIGALPTIGMVIFTAVLGAYLLKQQGLSTIASVQNTVGRGEIPAIELLEGLILIVAGALLLTPGFFTDTIGFILLTPLLRRRMVVWLLSHSNIIRPMGRRRKNPFDDDQPPHGPTTIEGEFRRED